MIMKTYLIAILSLSSCLSHSVFADTQTKQHTMHFISNPQAKAFALSAPAGLMVPPPNLITTNPIGLIPSPLQNSQMLLQNQIPSYQSLINRGTGPTPLLIEQIGQEGLRSSTHHLDSFQMAQNLRQSKSAFPAAKGTAGEIVKKQGQMPQTQSLDGKAHRSTPTAMKSIHQESLYAGLVGATLGGGIEVLSQLSSNQPFDWQRFGNITLLNGASGYSGTLGGALIQRSLINNQSQLLSKLLNPKVSASVLGGFSAGTLASALFAYGTYFLGYTDLKTAHRSMIAGTLGAGVFSVGNTMIQLILSKGLMASTLSTTAVMGTLSVTGVGLVALAALGVGTGTLYLFHLADKKAEHQRIEHLMTQIEKNLMLPVSE
ncbi:MAG: hypothetical protein DRR00_03845 [Candidatus Parabeggiatoa sp. nov. 3]|nr:MAG: hypothetical protein DRR00_03845 [Gammaproteobacteria bacterium]RKZ63580.1 MAG: hypothetical protein DRQ99_16895 [Gammaproteobacteria bacterium]